MGTAKTSFHRPRWLLIPLRVLLVTFLLTLVSFAVSLLLGILGIMIGSRLRGIPPNMTIAYRNVAAPSAAAVGAVVLVSAIMLEIRRYRQAKTLDGIERASR